VSFRHRKTLGMPGRLFRLLILSRFLDARVDVVGAQAELVEVLDKLCLQRLGVGFRWSLELST
jgi:hypothetical protein